MAGNENDFIEPMEPVHFDATTEYLRTQRGRTHSEAIIAAARLVLVEDKQPSEVLDMHEFKDAIKASTLWKAVQRYQRAFEVMAKSTNREIVTVVVKPEVARVLRAMDAEEINEMLKLVKNKKNLT